MNTASVRHDKAEVDQRVLHAELIALTYRTQEEIEAHSELNEPNLFFRDFAREFPNKCWRDEADSTLTNMRTMRLMLAVVAIAAVGKWSIILSSNHGSSTTWTLRQTSRNRPVLFRRHNP